MLCAAQDSFQTSDNRLYFLGAYFCLSSTVVKMRAICEENQLCVIVNTNKYYKLESNSKRCDRWAQTLPPPVWLWRNAINRDDRLSI